HSRLNRQIWYQHPNSEAGNDEIQNVNMDFYFVGAPVAGDSEYSSEFRMK
ncbi:hypothetical protein BROOK1789C_168, partial [Bathymodiolus brooksi thiotrophic gill symbiont]